MNIKMSAEEESAAVATEPDVLQDNKNPLSHRHTLHRVSAP